MSQARRWQCLIAAALLLAATIADAQGGRIHRIAFLEAATVEGQALTEAFRAGMRDLGYVEGRNVIYETRVADPDMSLGPRLVDELIASKPDVMVGSEHVAQVTPPWTASQTARWRAPA